MQERSGRLRRIRVARKNALTRGSAALGGSETCRDH